jgi:NAD(P)-dependent dehydrogenase (short-subunit alcohol dehydrogenase family)
VEPSRVPDFDLSGRVAVITGGKGGIGLGMADALAQAGCAVSIWGRNPEKNERACAQLRAYGGAVDARVCDVSDRKAIEAAFQATLAEFGRVDACFANAGIGGGGRRAFVERSEDEWRQMFTANLDSVFHVFQVAARHWSNGRNAGMRSADWSRLRAPRRSSAPRATSTMRRPRPRSTRSCAPWRSSWRATASPPTRSCRAGSRAT